MPNLLKQAINCNDGDAKIIQDALGLSFPNSGDGVTPVWPSGVTGGRFTIAKLLLDRQQQNRQRIYRDVESGEFDHDSLGRNLRRPRYRLNRVSGRILLTAKAARSAAFNAPRFMVG
jgi:hypothetical protein